MINFITQYAKSYDNRIIFLLNLDHKNKKERIIIGNFNQVIDYLNNKITDIILDLSRPLGKLIEKPHSEKIEDWNSQAIYELGYSFDESDCKIINNCEKSALRFLERKLDPENPIVYYIAYRFWHDYEKAREQFNMCYNEYEKECIEKSYIYDMQLLTMFFSTKLDYSETSKDVTTSYPRLGPHAKNSLISNQKIELYFLGEKKLYECAVAYNSITPLIHYYKHKLDEWQLHIKHCKVCGNLFTTNTLKQTFCSDKCKREQSKINKKKFDDYARENKYDILYKNYSQTWINNINKAKKSDIFSSTEINNMELLFKEFKSDALNEKRALKDRLSNIKPDNTTLIQKEIDTYEKYLHKKTITIHSIISDKYSQFDYK